MSPPLRARAIVLNYNGEHLLKSYLGSVVSSAEASRIPTGVTVLDNGSTDGSEEFVGRQFPTVSFVKARANRFLCSFNEYAAEIGEEAVILLNNDLRLEPDFCGQLLETLFAHPDALFAAPKSFGIESGSYEGSLSRMELRFGRLWGSARFAGYERIIDRPSHSMQCGFGAFYRERFLSLGGYDDLYLPGTVEDSDLCFRGWRRGWKGYYCPKAVAHHLGQASFKKSFGAAGIRRLNARNRYLFVWKNIRDPRLLAAHFFWMPFHWIREILTGKWPEMRGLWDALQRGRSCEARHRTGEPKPVLTERDVFAVSARLGFAAEGRP